MRARVTEKREVAKGTLLVLFAPLGEHVAYRAGSYFWVTRGRAAAGGGDRSSERRSSPRDALL